MKKDDHLSKLKELFPEVPVRLLARVPAGKIVDGSDYPFNRKRRRQILKSKFLVFNVFSGPDENYWKQYERNGVVVVCLDILLNCNLHDDKVAAWIEEVIKVRGVDLWLSGPPCRTTSLCRHRQDNGPPPLRGGEDADRFGLPSLEPRLLQQADDDSTLWLRNLWWMWLNKNHHPRAHNLIEQPRDPNTWKTNGEEDEEKYPSFLRWPETRKVAQLLGLKFIDLEQGELGHTTPKPTTLVTDVSELQCLHGLKGHGGKRTSSWPSTVEERVRFAKSLAAWAPGMKDIMGKAIQRLSAVDNPEVKKMSREEIDDMRGWEQHILQGHCPFRRDCAVCVETRGRDRRHVRQENVDAFCLSLDVSGPYSEGVDQTILKPRYYLTGVITIPCSGDNPLIEGLRELGMSIPEAQDALESNPLPSSTLPAQQGANLSSLTANNGRGEGAQQEGSETGVHDQQEGSKTGVHDCPYLPNIQEDEAPLTQAEIHEFDLLEQKWRECVQGRPTVEVKNLSQSVPIRSRKPKDIIEGVTWMLLRLKSLGAPTARVHTDRAREFISKEFRTFLQNKEIWQSCTAGDEPQTNGRVEAELGLVRGLARAAMKSSKVDPNMWPLAIRAASETRMRQQLQGLGVPVPQVLPFGIRALARRKTWNRESQWQSPNIPVRLLGPACDMSMFSEGYFAITNEGRFVRTTAVIIPKWCSRDEEVQAMQVTQPQMVNGAELALGGAENKACEGEEDSLLVEEPSEDPDLLLDLQVEVEPPRTTTAPPRRRLHGKHAVVTSAAAVPALSKVVHNAGGEWTGDEVEAARKEIEVIEKWLLFQHQGLQRVLLEMAGDVLEKNQVECERTWMNQVRSEVQEIEGQLKKIQEHQQQEVLELEEVLQTRTVSNQEVRENMEAWKQPFKEEYDTLCRTVIRPLTGEEVKEIQRSSKWVERIPSKIVPTIKPPCKKRGRIVACGNFASQQSEVAAGGIDNLCLRTVLRQAANARWQISVIDVSKAFLNAPRIEKPGHATLVDPPSILVWESCLDQRYGSWCGNRAQRSHIRTGREPAPLGTTP